MELTASRTAPNRGVMRRGDEENTTSPSHLINPIRDFATNHLILLSFTVLLLFKSHQLIFRYY
ncbi:hypothetical protein CKA32_005811 [Geitlerinema sp. FC II]|nr:hypothetical protein CKA32_005811 [Geitlerinema sp. FC II]